MKELENNFYLFLYITSNVVALLMLWAAAKDHRIFRILMALVFGWASWTNWNEALVAPQFYLDYSDTTFFSFYKQFINGWFSSHITASVGFIATCQAFIGYSMLMKGWFLKAGCIGAIIFLVAIAPLGVGAAFPSTLILAGANWVFLRKKDFGFLWSHPPRQFKNAAD